MKECIEYNWELLGAKLARLSDEEQGKFFHGFACELTHFESAHAAQLQMCFVQDKLTKKEQKILEENLPSLWYKEE